MFQYTFAIKIRNQYTHIYYWLFLSLYFFFLSKYQVHFEKNQFERIGLDGYIKLKWDAVPTIFNVPNAPMRLMPERKLKYKVTIKYMN